jgi:hypothetical protein
MKNKAFSAVMTGIIVSAFVVLLPGCNNDPMDIRIVFDKAPPVASVDVSLQREVDASVVIVSWDAVEYVSGYSLYIQEAGKKRITSLLASYTYNSDNDRYSARISVSNSYGGNYRFGIRTSPFDTGANTTYSDIVWSGEIRL